MGGIYHVTVEGLIGRQMRQDWHSSMIGLLQTNRSNVSWSIVKWKASCRQTDRELLSTTGAHKKLTAILYTGQTPSRHRWPYAQHLQYSNYSHCQFATKAWHQERIQNMAWEHKCMTQFWKRAEKSSSKNRLTAPLHYTFHIPQQTINEGNVLFPLGM